MKYMNSFLFFFILIFLNGSLIIMIDGEYNFFKQKLVELYTNKNIGDCVTHVHIDYRFVDEPSPQKRIIDQANGEFYAYASRTYPARKGLKCEYEDCECDGSDVTGCTYCRAPIHEDFDGLY